MHVHRSWVIVFCENWSSESHTSLRGINEFCTFHIRCLLWLKFDMRDMNIMLLNIHDFHIGGFREGLTLLVGANYITCIWTLFLASALHPYCCAAVVHLADVMATMCACCCGHNNIYPDRSLHTDNFLDLKEWMIDMWEQWIEVSRYKVLGLCFCNDDFIVYLEFVSYWCHVKSWQMHTFSAMRLLCWPWQYKKYPLLYKAEYNFTCIETCQIIVTEKNLRQLSEDKRYAYITYQDLRGIPEYRHQTIMAIKAPPEAKLQVPHPSQVSIRSVSQYISSVHVSLVVGLHMVVNIAFYHNPIFSMCGHYFV